MATPQATPDSQAEESNTLELPLACDLRDYVLWEPSQEAHSEAVSSAEALSIPSSSEVDPDSGHLNTTPSDSWASENFGLDPSVNGQAETKTEDEELRRSLDSLYETFGRPQPASRNPLSAAVCQCLSRRIDELRGQESQTYALRSFQMARVILSRDGCSLLQRYSRDARFYPLGEASQSLDDEKPTPGLSKDIIRFLLQQNVMEDA
ncbi:shieldin complex subunit 1 [Pipistrellus kuhlii]|uniref:Shieldin complex subunit 1 n=1 Tax=Pipistrellus kuhlii TaxID=59472 RepID=A0A7J7YC09_PIPKU|nr:shieldin complex subunit 1 [Pipistrellus kuhlii]KAF6359020.1 shieldin complex subunit 1 [Pipistrellus kuhlii]